MEDDLKQKSLGKRIAESKPFLKLFNDPIWDWTTQRWKGSIIRHTKTKDLESRCNYFDFSTLRPALIQELKKAIITGLQGDLSPIMQIIHDIDSDLQIRPGDLLQIGKTKNRGLFLISVPRILPITQLLGGNGFGEIPLTFICDMDNAKVDYRYDLDHWTFQNHPIIGRVPYIGKGKEACQNIRINGHTFHITEGSDSLNHPYTYLDFDTNEFFTLPAGIKHRFENEIQTVTDSFIASKDGGDNDDVPLISPKIVLRTGKPRNF